MSQSVPECAKVAEGGNTNSPSANKKINPAKHWVFTFNNYSDNDIDAILSTCSESASTWVFQEEKGEEGTKHLQGYLCFNFKKRPTSVFKWTNKIHWEIAKCPAQAIKYCSKEDTRNGKTWWSENIRPAEPLRLITPDKWWQQVLLQMFEKQADDRTIHWYWESVGGVGKTQFAKYVVACGKYNCLYLSGKAADMKHAIRLHVAGDGKTKVNERNKENLIILIDVPRESMHFLSYQGIEEIKNGIFFSGKYESTMVTYNAPHIVIFANSEPEVEKMSQDRWKIVEIA